MQKVVLVKTLEDVEPFPFDRFSPPTEETLRQYLYTAWWTLDDDGDHVVLMDYDGFVEYYDEHVPQWREEEGEGFWDDYSATEYLRDHVGVTICVVKEVSE